MIDKSREKASNKYPGGYRTVRLRKSSIMEKADGIVPIRGHGMSPMFRNGDEVFIQFTDNLEPGETGIFKYNGIIVIRQYYPEGLCSLRPSLETVHVDPDGHYEIIARVLGVVTDDMKPTEEEEKLLDTEKPLHEETELLDTKALPDIPTADSPVSDSPCKRPKHGWYPEREEKIYQACVIEGRSQRSLAQELGITSARVSQLLKRARSIHEDAEKIE